MMILDIDKIISNTISKTKQGKMKKASAFKRLDSVIQLKNNCLFNGKKRVIKKQVFKAKKIIRGI